MMFKRDFRFLFFMSPALAVGLYASAAGVDVTSSGYVPVRIVPERTTGLDALYVVYDVRDAEISYQPASGSAASVKWYVFSNLGGGYAQPVENITVQGDRSILADITPESGYIIEEDDKRTYIWITDYAAHAMDLRRLESGDPDCDATLLHVDGSVEPIHYYTINGQQRTLERELNIAFQTLEWDENIRQWQQNNVERTVEIANNIIRITPPVYCNTQFTLTGDRFLEKWGLEQKAESGTVHAVAVDCRTSATQDNEIAETTPSQQPDDETSPDTPDDAENTETEEGSNVIKTQTEGLGGSAPAEITFNAYVTDATLHTEWQMSHDPEFNDVEYRFNQQDLTYTFTEEGTYYLRFNGSNADGSCDVFSDTYTVSIGASELQCPNAFSPNGDGVNDKWKVAYRSLLDFKCWIFDRYGTQLFYFDNPSEGWDGTYKGKTVKNGVYYYVIQATGSDGKKYKKSGDINIIGYKTYGTPGGVPAE